MQPLTIITGILLGTSASIAGVSAIVVLLSLIVAGDSPRLAEELGQLWPLSLLFLAMTALCAAGFIGLVKHTAWRWYAQAAMWSGTVATAIYLLP